MIFWRFNEWKQQHGLTYKAYYRSKKISWIHYPYFEQEESVHFARLNATFGKYKITNYKNTNLYTQTQQKKHKITEIKYIP